MSGWYIGDRRWFWLTDCSLLQSVLNICPSGLHTVLLATNLELCVIIILSTGNTQISILLLFIPVFFCWAYDYDEWIKVYLHHLELCASRLQKNWTREGLFLILIASQTRFAPRELMNGSAAIMTGDSFSVRRHQRQITNIAAFFSGFGENPHLRIPRVSQSTQK